MTRKYEIVYIFDAALEEAQVTERLDRLHELLKSPDAAGAPEVDHWGKRTLAYPIKKKEQGYFVVVHVETDPTLLAEFERVLKLDDTVLRHLIVINDGAAQPVVEPEPQTDAADKPVVGATTEDA